MFLSLLQNWEVLSGFSLAVQPDSGTIRVSLSLALTTQLRNAKLHLKQQQPQGVHNAKVPARHKLSIFMTIL